VGDFAEYTCRNPVCRQHLFESDAPWGRVRITCPRCRRRQMHYLGGLQKRAEQPTADVPELVAGSRAQADSV
jgi:hypothetical protein